MARYLLLLLINIAYRVLGLLHLEGEENHLVREMVDAVQSAIVLSRSALEGHITRGAVLTVKKEFNEALDALAKRLT